MDKAPESWVIHIAQLHFLRLLCLPELRLSSGLVLLTLVCCCVFSGAEAWSCALDGFFASQSQVSEEWEGLSGSSEGIKSAVLVLESHSFLS